ATPTAAPTQPSPSASALASLSMNTGSPVSSVSRDRSGKSCQAGMFSGDTASPPAVIGPPQPTPQTATSPLPPTASISAATRAKTASASAAPVGVGATADAA